MQTPEKTPTIAKFLVLGTTDEVTACDCCGKSPLKMTYIVQLIDSPDVVNYYGSTCVTRNTQKTRKQVNDEIAAAEKAKVDAAKAEFEAHPANIAHKAKMQEAYALKLAPGKPFLEHNRAALLLANQAKSEIAAKHGIPVYKF